MKKYVISKSDPGCGKGGKTHIEAKCKDRSQ